MSNKKAEIHNYIMDRIQKLTEALYRVTDLYSDKEPLKWALRESGINIYVNLMSVMSIRNSSLGQTLEDALNSLSKIVNYLELASLGGFVSDANFAILKDGYQSLKQFIEGERNNLLKEERKLLLSQEMVAVAVTPKVSNQIITDKDKGQNHKEKMSDRKQKIIDFFKTGEKKTIKEIALNFEGSSEKSIQRDLIDLVKSGQLKAEGERRWRVYFLNNIDKNQE